MYCPFFVDHECLRKPSKSKIEESRRKHRVLVPGKFFSTPGRTFGLKCKGRKMIGEWISYREDLEE